MFGGFLSYSTERWKNGICFVPSTQHIARDMVVPSEKIGQLAGGWMDGGWIVEGWMDGWWMDGWVDGWSVGG